MLSADDVGIEHRPTAVAITWLLYSMPYVSLIASVPAAAGDVNIVLLSYIVLDFCDPWTAAVCGRVNKAKNRVWRRQKVGLCQKPDPRVNTKNDRHIYIFISQKTW